MPIDNESKRKKVRLSEAHSLEMERLARINQRTITGEVALAIEARLDDNRKIHRRKRK